MRHSPALHAVHMAHDTTITEDIDGSPGAMYRGEPASTTASHPRPPAHHGVTGIAAGADVKMLQTMLGHASAVMTLDRYGHIMPGRAQDVADRLDALARAAVAEPIAAAVPLDARDFAGWTPTGPTPAKAKIGPELVL